MRTTAVLASLLLATAAFAQQTLKIHSITPDHGPITGGTTVTITGENFNAGALVDPPCIDGAYLTIGGTVPKFVSGDETHLVVTTVPYTTGRFDVTVNVACMTATLKNAFTYGDPSDKWERMLLPVFQSQDVPGAHNSLWRTELAGFNTGFEGRITGDPEIPCSQPGGSCNGYTSSGAFTPAVTTDGHTPGRMLYVNTFNPSRTYFNLRVRDVSRASESLGTELPVLREDDAFGPLRYVALPNIPLTALYRAKLRLYRIDIDDPTPVSVDLYDGSHFLGTKSVQLSSEPQTAGFLLYPEYGELDLDTLPELAGLSKVNIDVRTPPQGLYYAMVSVTNNETQQITLISPR